MIDAVEVRRFSLFSHDPDAFDRWISEAYVDYERRRWGDMRGVSYAFAGAAVPQFSIATSAYGSGIEFLTETVAGVIVNTNRSGHFAASGGAMTVEPELGKLFLMPPGRPWRIRAEGFTNDPVHLRGPVLRAAASSLGWQGGDVRFTGCLPLPRREAYLAATIAHVRDNVLTGFERLPPLLLAEAGRSLAVATLMAFPNTVLDDLDDPLRPPPGGGEPATVRRAVEFIDAHAHDDIGIAEIAAAARLGPRGLQAAFRRHRDQTPLEYLRQVRMAGAHRDLRAADPSRGDTVGAIAARWGFTHPGRFSMEYRRAHGCSPSETLRG